MEGKKEQSGVIRKIKKYKLSVRPFGVLRHLKKKIPIESGQEPEDRVLESEISKVQSHLLPCALYATYSRSDTPEPLKVLWQSAPENSFSLSVIAATIGKPIEAEMEKISKTGDSYESALLESIARESFEQSFHFVARLLGEEAVEESCELSPLVTVGEGNLKEALEALEAHKADILINDSGSISPFFTGVRFCFWNPLKNKKR